MPLCLQVLCKDASNFACFSHLACLASAPDRPNLPFRSCSRSILCHNHFPAPIGCSGQLRLIIIEHCPFAMNFVHLKNTSLHCLVQCTSKQQVLPRLLELLEMTPSHVSPYTLSIANRRKFLFKLFNASSCGCCWAVQKSAFYGKHSEHYQLN